jgi:hypothetical protein
MPASAESKAPCAGVGDFKGADDVDDGDAIMECEAGLDQSQCSSLHHSTAQRLIFHKLLQYSPYLVTGIKKRRKICVTSMSSG